MKFALWHVYANTEGRRTSSNAFTTSAVEEDVWSALRFYSFTPEEVTAIIVQEVGWASEPL
jgi:hypothetical protein